MPPEIERINPDTLARPSSYSHGVVAGPLLFIAGQVGQDADRKLAEGGMEGQLRQALANFEAVLAAKNATFANVVWMQYFTTDFEAYEKVYGVKFEFYQGSMPADFVVEVKRLSGRFLIEIAGVAYLGADGAAPPRPAAAGA